MIELICATTTKARLTIDCVLDERTYEKGNKVADAEMDALDITGDAFHPECNHTSKPRKIAQSQQSLFGASLEPCAWSVHATCGAACVAHVHKPWGAITHLVAVRRVGSITTRLTYQSSLRTERPCRLLCSATLQDLPC
jgi:hypothetical protein